MKSLSESCAVCSLVISVKEIGSRRHGTKAPQEIHLGYYELENINKFTYLGSTITSRLNLEDEINSSTWKAVRKQQ